MTPPSSRSIVRRYGGFVVKFVLPAIVVAYAAILGVLYERQERMIFPGTALPPDHPFRFDQRFEEVRIPVPGASLDALHFMQDRPRGLVFFVHGNAGNLDVWATGLDFYRNIGYDLFIFDFRGYGKSTGTIESEAQLKTDVRAAWDYIAPQYAGKPIIVYGRSLGTGLAAALARDVNPALLVLVSPYTSVTAIAQQRFPFVPGWLVKYPLRTEAIIGDIKSPILMFHGSDDRLIPPSESEKLKALAKSPTDLVIVKGAHHGDVHRFPQYLNALADHALTVAGAM
jgi:alpha-beta hydrolase superfamily lysophospholipase